MSELVNYSTGTTVTSAWLNRAQLREEGKASYVIYSAGGTVYAKAMIPAGIDYSGTDAATIIQNSINALSASGGKIFIKAGTYNLTAALSIASSNVHIQGEGVGMVLLKPGK